jgi:hypothetical protein
MDFLLLETGKNLGELAEPDQRLAPDEIDDQRPPGGHQREDPADEIVSLGVRYRSQRRAAEVLGLKRVAPGTGQGALLRDLDR